MRRIVGLAAGLIVASSAFAPLALADHHEKAGDGHDHGAPGAAMDEAMMKQWTEMAAPGEHHQHIAKFAGAWNYKSKMWMDPSAPPMESEGKSTNEMILGGRFLKQNITGTMMGMPFEGISIDGFDKATGKHTAVWMDNMGTMTMMFEGACSAQDMSTTMTSTYLDPMSGQRTSSKTVSRWKDPGTMVFEMYNLLPDGSEVKTMEVVYTKAMEAKKAGS